ncbi:hypothetical protein [Phocaeicola paurosaccharolyticus]|jgi:uncharacterized protein YaeQ|uniref:hypothetical protein n=1 Tax=Phocaeicola paurosaccharolyticus TaxID=732242 RepID=UPI002FDF1F7A
MRSKSIFITLFLFIFAFCNAQSNNSFQEKISELYPDATQVSWQNNGIYKVALFDHNDFAMKVWLNKKAEWVMSVLDIQKTDELPTKVNNAFALSQYSKWNVSNVYWTTFSNRQEEFIIKVNNTKSTQTKEIFYSPSGEEIRNINVGYNNSNITPKLFGL